MGDFGIALGLNSRWAKCFLRIVVSMPLFTNAGSLKTPDSQLFSSKSTPSRDHKKKEANLKKKTMTFTNVIGFLVGKKKKKKNFFSLGRSNRRTLGAEASFAHSDASKI